MRPIDADVLTEHKFVGNKYIQIGGRRNGKTLEVVNRAYQQGWNDAIDAIIDNAPTFEPPWIPVGERLPEGKIDPLTNDFELVLCSTVWGIVRPLKFGKPIGHAKAHFWNGGSEMDIYVTAWMPLPEGYKEGDNKWL